MILKIKKKINQFVFNKKSKKILKTAPINYRQDTSVTIVSMVGHSSLCMYLIAIKSFMKNFGYGSIEAINDGSLTDSDISVLKHHIPNINISFANDVNTYDCPSYISWKRLFRVQTLSESSYVVQLDSDTISLGALNDIDYAVRNNKGFVTGCCRWSEGVDVNFLKEIVTQSPIDHVQNKSEAIFHKMEHFADGTKFLKGCAGFAGYPKGFASVDEIRHLSQQIEENIGKVWHGWGSEQTATLCLISKKPGSFVLRWPYYQNYKFPDTNENIESMNLIHFIGTYRFVDNTYSRLTESVIKNLR